MLSRAWKAELHLLHGMYYTGRLCINTAWKAELYQRHVAQQLDQNLSKISQGKGGN